MTKEIEQLHAQQASSQILVGNIVILAIYAGMKSSRNILPLIISRRLLYLIKKPSPMKNARLIYQTLSVTWMGFIMSYIILYLIENSLNIL